MPKYDIFISYRRNSDGCGIAGELHAKLENKGFSVFLDVDCSISAEFPQQIEDAIETCADFLLILSKGALDNCANPNDWLRKEIAFAIKLNKNIVCVTLNDFIHPLKEQIPDDINQLSVYQTFPWMHEFRKELFQRILNNLLSKPKTQLSLFHVLKIRPDIDCFVYKDGEKIVEIKANKVNKVNLPKGTHYFKFESSENNLDFIRRVYEVKGLGVEFFHQVELIPIQNRRIQSERNEKTDKVEPNSIEQANTILITVGNLSFEMIFVEGGSFMMGTNIEVDKDAHDNELTERKVILCDFYIGKHAVTQELWGEIMGNNPSYYQKSKLNFPVENVSWFDCQEFIKKLNKKTSKTFQLPTEAQWEYAAKGGIAGNSNFTFYSGSNNIEEVAFCEQNCNKKPQEVGRLKPNKLGIYDLSGNVSEWCYDWFGAYQKESIENPIGAKKGTQRVVRGGSWCNFPEFCRTTARNAHYPDYKIGHLGLRIVLNTNELL